MTREIPLTQGFVALVDDDDYAAVMASGSWHVQRNAAQPTSSYASRRRRAAEPGGWRGSAVLMHSFLCPEWEIVDHINLNGLDNRRSNLRRATFSQNMRNRRPLPTSTIGLKGVGPIAGQRWRARISIDGKLRHLGCFATPEEAALVYDRAARQHFGEFAWLNFPDRAA